MDIVGRVQASYACIQFPQNSSSIFFPRKSYSVRRRRGHISHRRISSAVVSVLGSPPPSVSELEEDDVLSTFFKERELDGDFISKVSDVLWLKRVVKFNDADADVDADADPELAQLRNETAADENEGGFLMLTRTLEWVAAGDSSAPFNKKIIAKDVQNDSEKRKRLNNLRYEAIKREILLLTISIGSLCSVYCLLALSVQAAVSYSAGVLFSCLYLKLLYQQTDKISKEAVPKIFTQKKIKKIGIRSEDLRDVFEKTVSGSGFVLASPRLIIPIAIYGLWGVSQHFGNNIFDFQLVPAMVGMFAYKAAALVQVYRDNEDLQLIFPGDDEDFTRRE
ncbi:uncharacterized protein LOC124936975 [Impatiens glandulifera]|uniref:uncharacterized protein LOC124936975 n=1 Tax=Impatiens glandulifera TaxID=253017 RepID=UPI001FB1483B|nr:uncharacterized protein LOC124936975 [Impatiens glandulifera]